MVVYVNTPKSDFSEALKYFVIVNLCVKQWSALWWQTVVHIMLYV